MTIEMLSYYVAVNLIDWFVTTDWGDNERKVFGKVVELLVWLELNADLHPEDVGDANDCGRCESWSDVVREFKKLIANGERIPIG